MPAFIQKKKSRWCMIKQKSIPIDIQIIETKDKSIPIKRKINTHIAFLSKTLDGDIKKIKKWSKNKNLKFRHGKWSNKELWFDLPDLFVNFTVEIMDTSIIK
jgi:hypothetical protein